MSERRRTSIPASVFSAFLGLLPMGIVVGILHGTGVLTTLALSAIVFGGLTVFVPWAVFKLDPRRLVEVEGEASTD